MIPMDRKETRTTEFQRCFKSKIILIVILYIYYYIIYTIYIVIYIILIIVKE